MGCGMSQVERERIRENRVNDLKQTRRLQLNSMGGLDLSASRGERGYLSWYACFIAAVASEDCQIEELIFNRTVLLGNCEWAMEGVCAAIAENKSIRTLRMNHLCFGNLKGVVPAFLEKLLRKNSTITHFDISDNTLVQSSGLFRAIAQHPALTHVNLAATNIGQDMGDIIGLQTILTESKTIHTLDLTSAYFDEGKRIMFFKSLRQNKSLHTLILSKQNLYMGEDQAKNALEALSMCNVRVLHMSGIFMLDPLELFMNGLKSNEKLEELYMPGCYIGTRDEVKNPPIAAGFVAEMLMANTTLRVLDLRSEGKYQQNNFGEEGGRTLLRAVKCNTTLMKLNLEGTKIGAAEEAEINRVLALPVAEREKLKGQVLMKEEEKKEEEEHERLAALRPKTVNFMKENELTFEDLVEMAKQLTSADVHPVDLVRFVKLRDKRDAEQMDAREAKQAKLRRAQQHQAAMVAAALATSAASTAAGGLTQQSDGVGKTFAKSAAEEVGGRAGNALANLVGL